MPGDQLMPTCEFGTISSVHSLNSASTLSSLKTHRASNNLNVVETDNTLSPRRANNISLGESQAVEIHLNSSSSPYSSPNVFGQQPLNLLSKNSASDPLLSVSALSSMTSSAHRANDLDIVEDDTVQRCTDNISPGECQPGDTRRPPSPFYLSSNSSSSSSDGVSTFFALIFIRLFS